MPSITTFVFFDIETTSLPHLEQNQTKITELSMIATSKTDILNTSIGSVPKVTKLTLVFNPQRPIHPDVVKMNGLTNTILKSAPTFGEEFKTINDFLINLAKPICIIAHNGNNFDYKILLAECNDCNLLLPSDLLCYDSIIAFRNILRDSNISFETLSKRESEKDNGETDEWPELDLSIEDIEQLDLSITGTVYEVQNKKKPTKHQRPPHKKLTKKQVAQKSKIISHIFNKHDGRSKKSSFKLEELYRRLLNKSPETCHRAEADCFMLLECVVALKTEFIKLAEASSIFLTDIQPLIRY